MTKARDIASATPVPSAVSATELGYVDGVTSAIQTQINAKATYPTQTGNSGKFLTTDGTNPSWGTVDAGGLVHLGTYTASNTALVSANNVFSSTYDNYRIVGTFAAVSGSPEAYLKLRASGSDSSGSYYSLYDYINIAAADVGTIKKSNSTNGIIINTFSTEEASFSFDIFRPFIAQETLFTGTGVQKFTSGNYYSATNAGIHDVSSSYDGITVIAGSAVNGSFSIYGYKKG